MAVQPLTSVACERAFSVMTRVKTALCNRMGEEALGYKMRVIANKIPVAQFDFPAAVAVWMRAKSRRYQYE